LDLKIRPSPLGVGRNYFCKAAVILSAFDCSKFQEFRQKKSRGISAAVFTVFHFRQNRKKFLKI
jgi:hypothetical protein